MKTKATSIFIERAEGPINDLGAFTFTGPTLWDDAQKQMEKWSRTCREGYDKCDFKVTFEDGETYEGRYDLVKGGLNDGGEKINEQIKAFVGFLTGECCPSHMDTQDYNQTIERYAMQQEAKNFLASYDLGLTSQN